MSGGLDAADELFVLELFEEVVDLPLTERVSHVSARLNGRANADLVGRRLTRLLEVESGLGELSHGPGFGPDLFAEFESTFDSIEDLEPGSRLGDFEVLEVVGRGGMGAVYRARQQQPSREVALKVLGMRKGGVDLARRLEREGHLLARLNHPGVATVYAMGVDEGRPWIAMEYVAGACTLLEFATRSGLDRAARLALFDDVLAAVQHGHQKGVVHRDLKPDNLLIGSDGRLRVIDFGIAALNEDHEPVPVVGASDSINLDPLRTDHGPRFGTLAYLAPEALAGPPDVRGDVFALGLILFELLLGRPARPVEIHREPSAAVAVMLAPIAIETQELPSSLVAILARALASDPADRYATVEAFARDLQAYRAHRPIDAVLVGGARFHALTCALRRHWPLASATLLAICILSVGLILSMRSAERETAQFKRAEEMRASAIGISLKLVTDFAGEVAKLSGGLETRRAMIQSGVAELERLGVQAEGLGPATELEIAAAYLSLGDVLGYVRGPNLGEFDRAEEAYDHAAQLFKGALTQLDQLDDVAGFEGRLNVTRLTERYATLARARGQFDRAAELYLEAEQQLIELGPNAPTDKDLARVELNQAQMMYMGAGLFGVKGEHAVARDLANRAAAIQTAVIERAPVGLDLVPARFNLQQSWSFVAVANSQLGESAAALKAFADARTLLDELYAQRPDDTVLRATRAGALIQEMDALRLAGYLDEALQLLNAGRVEFAALHKADPSDVRIQSSSGFLEALGGDVLLAHASAANKAGDQQGALEFEAAARAAFGHAIEQFQELERAGTLSGADAFQLQALLVKREKIEE